MVNSSFLKLFLELGTDIAKNLLDVLTFKFKVLFLVKVLSLHRLLLLSLLEITCTTENARLFRDSGIVKDSKDRRIIKHS